MTPERDAFAGTDHGAAVGFTVSDIFLTLASMIGGGRRGRRVRDEGPEEAPPAEEEAPARAGSRRIAQ